MKFSTIKYVGLASACTISFLSGAFVIKKLEQAPITANMILEAEKLIGFDFNPAQADSMLNLVNGFNQSYQSLRKLNMPNSVVPALNFNPIPVGFVNPDAQNGFKLNKLKNVKLPANKNELAFYTVRELSELIHTHQISSVELTRFFIDRLKKYQPKLLFAVTIMEERALKKAAEADAEIKAGHYRGILHGIPFGVKDLLAQKDYKTTFGSVAYKDQQLDVDATVITKLEVAGGILIAKTTLGELAQGDVWFGGKTKNPWDINAAQAAHRQVQHQQ